jgi:pimeloyl-ACP methyl ester carboxylesterase
MSSKVPPTGLAPVNGAQLYYEVAGSGAPLVMIHAGVADSRQWNNEFARFQGRFRVLRYDLRGYGKSEPVDGEFAHLRDLVALLSYLHVDQPPILMGCSMGGGLALDYALDHPARALVLVGSGPSGLELDVPKHPMVDEAEKAYTEGDLDRVAELETQIWFDGMGRTASQVDPAMRRLAYEMNRRGLELDAMHLGKRVPDASTPAVQRLGKLMIPVLIVVGAHDTPYIQAAGSHMLEGLPSARRVVIEDAAHLANMDQPGEFGRIVTSFLDELGV